jgi:hypothetical protein
MGVGDDIAQTVKSGVAAHLLSGGTRAAQAGLKAASVAGSIAEQEAFYKYLALPDAKNRSDDGLEIILDRSITKEPELFYGPFLQLGTYLELESPFMRLGLDIVADPLSWVPVDLGLGRLNKVGKLGRLLSTVTHGGKASMTAEKALAKVERVLTFYGKAAGVPEVASKILGSSKKLLPGEFKSLVKTIEAADVPAHFQDVLAIVGKDRKALASLLNLGKNEKTAKLGFSAADLLQPTFKSQLAAGQRTIFEFHKPFAMTRSFLGSPYRDHVLWRPTFPAALMPEGGARAFGDDLTRKVSASLSPEYHLDPGKFQPDPGKTFTVTLDDFTIALKDIEVSRLPSGGELVHGAELSPEAGLTAYNRMYPTDPKGKGFIESDTFRTWFKEYAERYETARTLDIDILTRRKEAAVADLTGMTRERLKVIGAESGMSEEQAEAFIGDRLAGAVKRREALKPATIAADSRGFDLGIAGAQRAQRMQAKQTVDTLRELFSKNFARTGDRERMLPAFRALMEHGPEHFLVSDTGRGVLSSSLDEVKKASPIFGDYLAANPDIEAFLRKEGMPSELTSAAAQTSVLMENLGAQLITHDHVIPEYVGGYVSRVGKFTRKGRKQLHLDPGALDTDIGQTVLNQLDLGPDIDKLAKSDKGGETAFSFRKIRSKTEAQLLAWEKLGYYKMEKDPVFILGEYLDQTTTALLNNDLFTELPRLVGNVSELDVPKLIASGIPETEARALRGKPRMTWKDPGTRQRGHYTAFKASKRYGVPTIDQAAELKNLETGYSIHDSLAGLTEVQGVKVMRKATGQPVQLKSGWVRLDSYPDSLKNVMEVKAAVKREIAARLGARRAEIAASLTDDSGRLIGKESHLPKLWVLKPYAGEINQAFRFWSDEGMASIKAWRTFDNLNSRLKGLVLAIDAFHGNVLTAASLMLNPAKMAEVLSMPKEVFHGGLAGARLARTSFAGRTAVGAAAGVGAAVGLGAEDPSQLAVGGIAGALWANAITAAVRNGLLGHRALLTPGTSEALAYMGLAGWTGRPNDRSIGIIGRGLQSLANSMRRTGLPEALIHPIDGLRHLEEGFNQGLWEVVHNGAKTTYFQARFNQAKAARLAAGGARNVVNGIDQDLLKDATEILQSADIFFGGMNYARLFANPEMQSTLRRFLLSPDWTSGRLLGAANMMLNMSAPAMVASSAVAGTAFELAANGFDPELLTGKGTVGGGAIGLFLGNWAGRVNARMMTKGDIMARESRKLYSAAILGGYFMGNLLNYAFTGKWMFENEEGDKLSVLFPDGSKFKFGKAYKEAFEVTGAEEHFGVPILSRASSKLSVPIKSSVEILSTRSWNGPIVAADQDLLQQAGSFLSYAVGNLTPIFAAGPSREAGQFLAGNREGVQVATQIILRGAGLGFTSPKKDTREPIREGLRALAGLPTLGEKGLSSLATSQRNLR